MGATRQLVITLMTLKYIRFFSGFCSKVNNEGLQVC